LNVRKGRHYSAERETLFLGDDFRSTSELSMKVVILLSFFNT